MKFKITLIFLLIWTSLTLSGQNIRAGAPNFYIDCQSYCDIQFLKNEMTYVNFVRDRAAADIYCMLTAIETGNGGRRFTLLAYGQKQFEHQSDSLEFTTAPAVSEDVIRQALKTNLEKILVPYLLRTPMAEWIKFTYEKPEKKDSTVAVRDPWNFWTFSVGVNLFANGDANYGNFSYSGNMAANRVTNARKTRFSFFANENRDKYVFEDSDGSETVTRTVTRSVYASFSEVYSLNNHLSAGFFTNYNASIYSNFKTKLGINAAVEYNFFPYKNAANRRFTANYFLGPEHRIYVDTTVYDHTKETLLHHNAGISYYEVKKWGTINASAYYGSFLHNSKLNNFSFNSFIDLNLFKGFTLGFGGFFGINHDQINLRKSGATRDETLLRIKELESGYNFFFSTRVNYTFGSNNSNVVNPRFDGDGGTFYF